MNHRFLLSCESTVDMPYAYVSSRQIPVLFYSYLVDDQTYPDDMGRDPQALPRFYDILRQGKLPTTSQLNEYQYEEFLEPLVREHDVLHICFGSGMTASAANAEKAAQVLREKYPEHRLVVIDSLCSSSGYGLLVDLAADLRDQGRSLDETAQWVLENRGKIHHQFFSTDLKFFRRSGRMSGPAAMLGSVLNICPIMRLDDGGHIIAYDKVRGKKKAIERTAAMMALHAQGGTDYAGRCFICHADCLADAEALRDEVVAAFPQLSGEVRIFDIGTIIASHCGPGTVALFFLGDAREAYHSGT